MYIYFDIVCIFNFYLLSSCLFIFCLQISDQPVLANETKPDQPIIFDPKSTTLTRMTGRRQKLPSAKPDTSGQYYIPKRVF